MNKPELYSASNMIQMTVSISNLKEYINKIKWNKSEDTAIDIGCGDGSVSVLVKNVTPSTYMKFVACDVSKEMINFAKKRYIDEDIQFKVMDIAGEVPEDMKGAFNHVFSFYTLHWVKDQEAAFRNIYDLMSNEGDCFMTFIGASDLYKAYAAIAHHTKWKSCLKDLNSKFKGPYCDVKNPEKKVEELMTKSGFRNIEVNLKLNANSYDSVQALKNFIQSLEPFNMPNEVFDDFFKDFITVSQEIGMLRVENNENMGKTYFINDYVLVIYATKCSP